MFEIAIGDDSAIPEDIFNALKTRVQSDGAAGYYPPFVAEDENGERVEIGKLIELKRNPIDGIISAVLNVDIGLEVDRNARIVHVIIKKEAKTSDQPRR